MSAQKENSKLKLEASDDRDVKSEIRSDESGNQYLNPIQRGKSESKIQSKGEISDSKENRELIKISREPSNKSGTNILTKIDESNLGGNLNKSKRIDNIETNSKSNNDLSFILNVQNEDSNKISLKKLFTLKKEHKNLNTQLHIFSHKLEFNIEPIKKNNLTSSSVDKKIIFPKIKNKNVTHNKDDKFSNAFGVDKYIIPNPKFKYSDTKNKILKSKEILEEHKQIRLKQAKEMKEANRLLRENILILKEKVKEENRQKKKIVDSKYEFIKNSISNFKLLKQKYIKNILNSDIERETKEINQKLIKLETLKDLHEKSKNSRTKNLELKLEDNFNETSNPENEIQLKTANSEEESEENNYHFNEDKNEENNLDDNFNIDEKQS